MPDRSASSTFHISYFSIRAERCELIASIDMWQAPDAKSDHRHTPAWSLYQPRFLKNFFNRQVHPLILCLHYGMFYECFVFRSKARRVVFFGATKQQKISQKKNSNLYFMRAQKNGSWKDVWMLKSRWLSWAPKRSFFYYIFEYAETSFECFKPRKRKNMPASLR